MGGRRPALNQSKLVAKVDLESQEAIKGKLTAKLLELIRQLKKEGLIGKYDGYLGITGRRSLF